MSNKMPKRRRGKRLTLKRIVCNKNDQLSDRSSTIVEENSTATNSSINPIIINDSDSESTSSPKWQSIADELKEYVANTKRGVNAVVKNLKKNDHSKDSGSSRNITSKTKPSAVKTKIKTRKQPNDTKLKSETDNIWTDTEASIVTITAQQIRKANKSPKQNNKSILLDIPSAIERSKIYNEAAVAIARKESISLPSNGSRPWQCQVIIKDDLGGTSDVDTTWTNPACATTESQAAKKKSVNGSSGEGSKTSNKKMSPPLFRWYRNEIELAVLPHFLQMIDVVDVNLGKIKKIKVVQEKISDEMDESKATDMTERKVTMLSTLAWEGGYHAIPEVERRWVSPDQVMFRSRETVLEHVELLFERDTIIDRVLHGCGKRGDMLRPIKVARSKALEAGHYRFLRDGLWVVGQENDWLIERLEERHAKAIEKKKKETPIGDGNKAIENVEQLLTEEELKISIEKQEDELVKEKYWTLTDEQTLLCYNAVMDQYEKVINTVKARELYHELEDGFDIFRERGRGRFDMQLPVFDTPEFDFLTNLKKAVWMKVVKKILGDDATLIHKGAFLSMPGSQTQVYHQDGVHLTTKCQRPCHAINVFIPLVELTGKNGPTEFCLGTHMLGYEGYAKDMIETPEVLAGTPVMFDYRLGHRGLRNTSSHCRPIVYLTYTSESNEFRDSVNFSKKSYHELGDLIEKPMSREERALKRMRKSD